MFKDSSNVLHYALLAKVTPTNRLLGGFLVEWGV